MPDPNETTITPIDSPPPSAMPVRESNGVDDARQTLHRLALELMRTQNRKLLADFLQLRRALR